MAICFCPPPTHSLFCQTSEQVNSSMKALQAEKERLMRSMSEREAELSSLRQAAQAQQSSLQQEQERNSRELGELQGKLQEKVSSQEAQAQLSTHACSLPPLLHTIQQYYGYRYLVYING